MRSIDFFVLVGCGVLGLSSAVGCGSDEPFTGSGGAGGDPGSGATGGAAEGGAGVGGASSSPVSSSTGTPVCPGLGDACTECEAATCQAQYCACYQNAACVDLASCGLACAPDDLECFQACWAANPTGVSDGALLVDCAAEKCAEGCPGLTPLTPCQECLYQQCPAAMNTCIANAECSALLFCVASCTTPGCNDDCAAQHPNGLTDAGPVAECAETQCSASCQ